jgi:hypothetical protein
LFRASPSFLQVARHRRHSLADENTRRDGGPTPFAARRLFIVRIRILGNAVPTGWRLVRREGTLVCMNRGRPQQLKIPAEGPFATVLPYGAAAAAATASANALGFGAPLRIGLPLVLLAFGMQRAFNASVRRTRLRIRADEWLESAASPNPNVFAWRVQELLGSERRGIARALRAYAQEIMRPWRPGAPRLNRRRLRSEATLLAAVADALNDDRIELSPRAVLRARRLVTDVGSPLHSSARHDELRPRLEELLFETGARRARPRPASEAGGLVEPADRMQLSSSNDGFDDR